MSRLLEADHLHGDVRDDDVQGLAGNLPASDLHIVRLDACKTQSPADRDLRVRLHRHRYLMFQSGTTVREIAATEGVDERQIYLSISRVETRMPRAEVIASRNFRNALIIQQKLAEKYLITLSDLLDGRGGKNWYQRCRALQHFRRTVGMEGGAAVHVNTEVNLRTGAATDSSYEERLARIRAAQEAVGHPGTRLQPSSGRVLAMLSSAAPDSE